MRSEAKGIVRWNWSRLRRTGRVGAALVASVLLSPAAQAAVSGRIVSAAGTAIANARVEASDSGVTFSDENGSFAFEGLEGPSELVVSHPRFRTTRVAVPAARSESLVIVLPPKLQLDEEIAVSARHPAWRPPPRSAASTVVSLPRGPRAAAVKELLIAVPGVSENGQGGLLQAYSLRGLSRRRVVTLVSGMRIVSDRRAGVAASFLDPTLLAGAEVTKAAVSSQYGSGAIGGVVHLVPRRFGRLGLEVGLDSNGDGRFAAVGWGNEAWSLGLASRAADEGESPGGERLHSGFRQTSLVAQRRWSRDRFETRGQIFGAIGDDIGKANTLFPERKTTYPEEAHLLTRVSVSSVDWQLSGWTHSNRLKTRVEEDTTVEVDSRAFDFGLDARHELELGPNLIGRFGIDYFGRRGVDISETLPSADGGLSGRVDSLRGAASDEVGLFSALDLRLAGSLIEIGGSLLWNRQANDTISTESDNGGGLSLGLVRPLGRGFQLLASVGTSVRFPSLSERFFSGTTGRGSVVANRDLRAERSLNAEVGLRWFGDHLSVTGAVFRNRVDDFVERIEDSAGELTFRNLKSGDLRGAEVEGLYRLDDRWWLFFGGHAIEGRSFDDNPLRDVPSDRFHLGARLLRGRWQAEGRWEHRRAKSDPAAGEKSIPAASLLSARIVYDLRADLDVGLSASNLLDESYFSSADRLVPLAPRRSVAVAVRWRAGGG